MHGFEAQTIVPTPSDPATIAVKWVPALVHIALAQLVVEERELLLKPSESCREDPGLTSKLVGGFPAGL